MTKLQEEAVKRMEMLKMSRQCINAFKRGEIWESEGIGALYECNDKEKKIIEEFRINNPECCVYHMIHNIFEFGECYTILFVSCYEDEWEEEREGMQNGYMFAYVKNVDDEWCSEFGTIGFKSNIGGLIRVS